LDDKFIVWPKEFSEEQKECFKSYLEFFARKQQSLCVIYLPDCGCPIEQMVILDRYPMSPKIISSCPECKKGCLMEISDPIAFYLPLTKQDFSLEDLKKMYVTDSPQKDLINCYKLYDPSIPLD
jgi:hypothetical protein